MVGLPNTKVLPLGWAQHHRPVTVGTMTGSCQIVRPVEGPPPYPVPEGWTPESTVHESACRLQELKREGAPVPADQPTQTRQYLLTVPYDGLPQILVGEGGDAAIVDGRRYQLLQQMQGTLLWEWDFICLDNQTQNQ